MQETSKLLSYRQDNNYSTYFKGDGVDIGCGNDVLSFEGITSILPYDKEAGDAQCCSNLKDDSFDFVYSSHCLEDLRDPYEGLENWIRVCKSDGYIVVSVPHEIFYEKNVWPSPYNQNHKHSFRMERTTSMPNSINVYEMLNFYKNVSLIRCDFLLMNFDLTRFTEDQTRGDAICQIEFVLKKK